jgi:TetR/AcrR family transcriptional repressor of nem operon
MTTHSTDGRADVTRRHILRAAAHQFARRAYHDVGLDDILVQAELTKGAMYFHFRSKHALAVAIIERQTAAGSSAVEDLLARGLSGLETLIDFSYLIAVQDIKTDGVRAGLNLLGDIDQQSDPQDVGRMMVSLHMGLRQTSNLDEPERFLHDLEKCWAILLKGILEPDRFEYFRQFLRRRAALAINASSAGADSD